MNIFSRALAAVLVFVMLTGAHVPVSFASMVATESVLTASRADDYRGRILSFLDRADVRDRLGDYGVAPAEARARVASLTDREARWLAQEIDRLPAGRGGLGTVLFIAAIVVVVLVITDILGITDLFPWAGPVKS